MRDSKTDTKNEVQPDSVIIWADFTSRRHFRVRTDDRKKDVSEAERRRVQSWLKGPDGDDAA